MFQPTGKDVYITYVMYVYGGQEFTGCSRMFCTCSADSVPEVFLMPQRGGGSRGHSRRYT